MGSRSIGDTSGSPSDPRIRSISSRGVPLLPPRQGRPAPGAVPRRRCGARRPGQPRSGPVHPADASVTATASGGNGGRSCLGCPGWPRIFRFLCDPVGGDLGGLTMSLEGGFDDVVEFFRAVASSLSSWLIRCVCCSMRFANSAFRASKRRMTAKSSRSDGASLRRFLMHYPSESTRKTCHSVFGAVNGYAFGRCTSRFTSRVFVWYRSWS